MWPWQLSKKDAKEDLCNQVHAPVRETTGCAENGPSASVSAAPAGSKTVENFWSTSSAKEIQHI